MGEESPAPCWEVSARPSPAGVFPWPLGRYSGPAGLREPPRAEANVFMQHGTNVSVGLL